MKFKRLFKVPKLSKRTLLIAGAVGVVIGVFLVALVYQVWQERIDSEWAAQTEAARVAEEKATATKIQALETSFKTAISEKQILCSYLKSLNEAKATKTLTTLPAAAHCK